jgi:hypothetical protein
LQLILLGYEPIGHVVDLSSASRNEYFASAEPQFLRA